MSEETDIRLAASAGEAAAIMAVVRMLRKAQPAPSAPTRSGWQRAARREALRHELPHEAGGWGSVARRGQ